MEAWGRGVIRCSVFGDLTSVVTKYLKLFTPRKMEKSPEIPMLSAKGVRLASPALRVGDSASCWASLVSILGVYRGEA